MSDLSSDYEQFMAACRGYLKGDDSLSLSGIKKRYPQFANGLEEQLDGLRIVMQVAKPRVGEPIAHYILEREIASGGMGQVFLARDVGDEIRHFAIKILSLSERRQGSRAERFLLETNAMSQLEHEHIVPVVDHGVDAGWAWLAMPYINGTSLDDILFPKEREAQSSGVAGVQAKIQFSDFFDGLDGRSEFDWIAKCGADIASGLAEAHAAGIIHRDIKPGNLILDRDGKIWIVDFGLVKVLDNEYDLSMSGDMIGTPRYMSPEQFRGFADQRSDVYSLGITLWEMVCKRKANESSADQRGQWKVVLPLVQEANPQVPVELAEVIDKACSIDPRDRFATAEELKQALVAASVGERTVFARAHKVKAGSGFATRAAFTALGLLVALAAAYLARTFERSNASPQQTAAVVIQDEFYVKENTTVVGVLPVPKSEKWWLGGADADLFSFDPDSQALAFRTAPDFELPNSQQDNNHYQIALIPSRRNASVADARQVNIFVIDSDEPVELANVDPSGCHSIEVNEGQLVVPLQSFGPTDPENQPWVARIAGGKDARSFAVYDKRLVLLDLEPRESPYEVAIEFSDDPGDINLAISYDATTNKMLLGDIRGEQAAVPLSRFDAEFDPRFVRAVTVVDDRNLKLFRVNGDSVELWNMSLTQKLAPSKIGLQIQDCGIKNGVLAVASRDGIHYLIFGGAHLPMVGSDPPFLIGGCGVYYGKLKPNGTFSVVNSNVMLSGRADVVGGEFVSDNLVVLHTRDRFRSWLLDPATLKLLGSVTAATPYQVRGWTVLKRTRPRKHGIGLKLSVSVKPLPVRIFQRQNFEGLSTALGVGSYDEEFLDWTAVGNDNISSIEISDGYGVRIAKGTADLPTAKNFESSVSNLGDFDNTISWIQVYRTGPPDGAAD